MGKQQTRRLARPRRRDEFAERHRVSVVIVEGDAEGTEFELEEQSVVVGRAPDADIVLEDPAISQHHAAFERTLEGYRVRDLKSTNGTRVNGASVQAAELKHGDRVELGEHVLQYVVEFRERLPRTFEAA
jgi:pSer/pThr/pTyr-binding forkhead associated (FHA) protein